MAVVPPIYYREATNDDWVRKRAKRPGREPGDFVGSTPTLVTSNRARLPEGKRAQGGSYKRSRGPTATTPG